MLNEKKVVHKLRQEVKMKVDIVTSDDIKIYYTAKFQDFTARYIINLCILFCFRAAELMTRTGHTVTLKVAKQGAIYHGLATLLSQPSPIMQRGMLLYQCSHVPKRQILNTSKLKEVADDNFEL